MPILHFKKDAEDLYWVSEASRKEPPCLIFGSLKKNVSISLIMAILLIYTLLFFTICRAEIYPEVQVLAPEI